jgi:hypothetical protein
VSYQVAFLTAHLGQFDLAKKSYQKSPNGLVWQQVALMQKSPSVRQMYSTHMLDEIHFHTAASNPLVIRKILAAIEWTR